MKWTFKSHKGFFVPVIYNNVIKGLRIHLDEKYNMETTDIWFSSSKEYMGANAKNWMLLLIPNDITNFELINDNRIGRDIVISSEMILAYKAYNEFNKITIGLPNTISVKQGKEILSNIKIRKADIYLDLHTIFTDPTPIYRNLLNYLDKDNVYEKLIITDRQMSEIRNDESIKIA